MCCLYFLQLQIDHSVVGANYRGQEPIGELQTLKGAGDYLTNAPKWEACGICDTTIISLFFFLVYFINVTCCFFNCIDILTILGRVQPISYRFLQFYKLPNLTWMP